MRILIIQMGGLGDLVLTAELAASLKTSQPDARITLVCRKPQHRVAELYPVPPDEVVALEFNPYVWATPSEELHTQACELLETIRRAGGNLLIAAGLQPTWLDWLVASALPAARAVACTGASRPEGLLPLMLKSMGLAARDFEGPTFRPEMHERERYAAIARYLGCELHAALRWHSPLPDPVLERLGLRSRQFVACFPMGTANVAMKRWPLERFAVVLDAIGREFPVGILLAGSDAEKPELERLARKLERSPAIFAGGPADVGALAALLASARAWVGNDSGPAHLAAAYRVPGVTVYGGGGHWRAYAPWSDGSIGVVHPLPCFDCNWDCLFGHPVCLEMVPVEAVLDALRRALTDSPQPPRWMPVERLSSETLDLIRDASAVYRAAQADRAARLAKILELKDAADERLAHLERAWAEIDRLRRSQE